MSAPWTIHNKCAAARHPQHELVAFQDKSGRLSYGLHCQRCARKVTVEITGKHTLSKAEATARLACDASLDDLPVINFVTQIRACYVCGSFARCEDDHVAERAIHGELAELLPIVPLCPKCHDQKSKNLQAFIRKHRGTAA